MFKLDQMCMSTTELIFNDFGRISIEHTRDNCIFSKEAIYTGQARAKRRFMHGNVQ